MTAAVSSAARELELEPQPGSVFGPEVEIGRPTQRVPYLTAVPDCEPPFDDDVPAGSGSVRPGLLRMPQISVRDDHPTGPAGVTARRSGIPGHLLPADREVVSVRPPARISTSPSGRVINRPATAAPTAASPRRTAPTDQPREAPAGGGPTTIASHSVPKWSSEADVGVRLTASENLPPAKRSASVLARALVEVLSGRRPVAQLRVHCAPEIYAGLLDRPAPVPMSLPHLLTVHVCEPADGVAEVSAAFRRAERVRALAFRIQGVDGRWRITALQLG